HCTAAGRVDDVSRGLGSDQGVQPGGVSAHSPAGLVGHYPVGLTHGLANGLIDRFAAGGGPQDGVDAAAAAEVDAEQAGEAADHLAVGESALLIEFDDGGLGVRSELRRGGTEGVRRLQRVASLNPTLAVATPADVDVELPVNRLARDFDLELL